MIDFFTIKCVQFFNITSHAISWKWDKELSMLERVGIGNRFDDIIKSDSYYHEDPHMLKRAVDLQQRIFEKIGPFEAQQEKDKDLSRLSCEKNERRWPHPLSNFIDRVERIDNNQNKGKNSFQLEKQHETAMKFARRALRKAEKEIGKSRLIRFEQQNLKGSIILVERQLKVDFKRLHCLREKQAGLSGMVDSVKKGLRKGRVKLREMSSRIFKIQADNKRIDETCIHLKSRCERLDDKQKKLGNRLRKGNSFKPSRGVAQAVVDAIKKRKKFVNKGGLMNRNLTDAHSKSYFERLVLVFNKMRRCLEMVCDFRLKIRLDTCVTSHVHVRSLIKIFALCFICIATTRYRLISPLRIAPLSFSRF